MKVLIWNCSGVGKKGISAYLRGLIGDFDLDFLGIQETMKSFFLIPFLEESIL